ncbi:MAG: efflux RND transporter permease subunit, partial [Arcobacteraceae bacterium]|nr:efflux RND transporter permease subunit [Arcobacteraceae bacterium]
ENAPIDFSSMIKGRLFDSGENIANILVNLKREDQRDENSIFAVHRLRPIIQNSCKMHNVNIKIIESPAGPPVQASIVLEITSDIDHKKLENFAYDLKKIFLTTPSLVDMDIIGDESFTKFGIVLNENKIINSNIQLDQVKKILYLAFEGMDIAFSNDANSQNQLSIHLVLSKETKTFSSNTKDDILNKLSALKLMNPQGMMIPLGELVDVQEQINEHKIVSKNLSPMVSIVAQTDMESQLYPLLDIRTKIIEQYSNDYEIEEVTMFDLKLTHKDTQEVFNLHWDGEQKLSIDTIVDLSIALGVAIVFIYFMMVVYYKNFSIAGAIILASFIAIAGVIYAHWIYDLFTPSAFYMTGTSLIGFIALIGINSRNSLLIIDFVQQLIEEKHLSVEKAIAVSVQTRAKPILLTVLAIIFASALLATDPVFGGLGIALIGGTLAAYLVSLFIVPVIIQKPLNRLYSLNTTIN